MKLLETLVIFNSYSFFYKGYSFTFGKRNRRCTPVCMVTQINHLVMVRVLKESTVFVSYVKTTSGCRSILVLVPPGPKSSTRNKDTTKLECRLDLWAEYSGRLLFQVA